MKKLLSSLAVVVASFAVVAVAKNSATTPYVPQAVYCLDQTAASAASPLCAALPGNIGPDPALSANGVAYNGIHVKRPQSFNEDVQTPFDNLSWQTFVALNWTAGKQSAPPEQGLQGTGPRVWETYKRVSHVFGNSPVQANCSDVPAGIDVFSIASDGNHNPKARNEEYIEAATGDPLIDVDGNWTLYERRLNDREIAYLTSPLGKGKGNLMTQGGQSLFIASGGIVDFPWSPGIGTGAIEIKAAWRILHPGKDNEKSYYVEHAYLKVAGDLVTGGKQICRKVDLGLVAMHIIQKNPPKQADSGLEQQWFWSTFEHVNNAPPAVHSCDPVVPQQCTSLTSGSASNCPPAQPVPPYYSYFDPYCQNCSTNQPPTASSGAPSFVWNATEPYAKSYLTMQNGHAIGTQVSRCWQIYWGTNALNTQWRDQLKKIGSVFQNYMLIGTQWGGDLTSTPIPQIPGKGVPTYLSNTAVETYIQTSYNRNNPGSCVACHQGATLAAGQPQPQSNFSFLPGLADPSLLRRPPINAAAQR
ncbi:MAG TPA: hypothetical protein VGM17_16230 [Rhizomicrobium sp.]